ncbi:MAG: hypothetical protein NT003_04780 [Candidatus Magasanikbacteria bacterium]|nr:hypothetical protein [Candidatus Magasanikbacteria bacterium]
MDKRMNAARALGILTAVIPAAIILLSHTAVWPEFAAARTDTFFPKGPELTFSDFTPGQRTDVLKNIDGYQVRPITDAPVYILFQPRRHTPVVRVEIEARQSTTLTDEPHIGYRHGETVEGNKFVPTNVEYLKDGWVRLSAFMPMNEMTVERMDARRIVLQTNATSDKPWFVKSVRIFYEKI